VGTKLNANRAGRMTYHILVWSELNGKSSCGCGIFRWKRGEGSGGDLRWDLRRAGDAAALMSLEYSRQLWLPVRPADQMTRGSGHRLSLLLLELDPRTNSPSNIHHRLADD
jgi:hypothetical protein